MKNNPRRGGIFFQLWKGLRAAILSRILLWRCKIGFGMVQRGVWRKGRILQIGFMMQRSDLNPNNSTQIVRFGQYSGGDYVTVVRPSWLGSYSIVP